MKYILIAFMCIPSMLKAEECTTNKYVIKNLERRMTKKIVQVWIKEGRHKELDRFDMQKLAKRDAKQVIKDNYTCQK